MNNLLIKDPLQPFKYKRVHFVDHNAPEEHKRNEWAYMKRRVGDELYRLLEQSTYPCMVWIDEKIEEGYDRSLDYPFMPSDVLKITVEINPVERKHNY